MVNLHSNGIPDAKLKVLFLPRWYPFQQDPMFGLFIERHASCIAQHAEVKVLFVHPLAGLPSGLHFRRQNRNGIDTLCIHYNKVLTRSKTINAIVGIAYYIFGNIKGYKTLYPGNGRPNLCHVHVLTRPAFLALWLKIFYNIPFIITEHWSRYHKELGRYQGFLRKWVTSAIAKRASSVTAVTDHLRKAMQQCEIRNHNFVLLPNIVDTELFNIEVNKIPSQRKVFVHISTFEDASKNISGMLRVVARLASQRQNFTFKLIGDGIDFEAMKQFASNLGLSYPVVEFVGLANDKQVAHYLNEADFMMMFSNYENQPVVIIESFSCGTPVLATRVGGITEMVSDEKGLLIEHGKEDELFKGICFMLDNSEKFDKSIMRNYAVSTFSTNVIGAQLLELYSNALNQ